MKLGLIDVSTYRRQTAGRPIRLAVDDEIVAAYPPDVINVRFGARSLYEGAILCDDWSQIMDNTDVDGIVLLSDWTLPVEIVLAAMRVGKVVFSGSSMFASKQEAMAIAEVARDQGTPSGLRAKAPFGGRSAIRRFVFEEGRLGDLEEVKLNVVASAFAKGSHDPPYDHFDSVAGTVFAAVPYISWVLSMWGHVSYLEAHCSLRMSSVIERDQRSWMNLPPAPGVTILGAFASETQFLFRISPCGTSRTSNTLWILGSDAMLCYDLARDAVRVFGTKNRAIDEVDASDSDQEDSDWWKINTRCEDLTGTIGDSVDLGYALNIGDLANRSVHAQARLYVADAV